MRLALVAAVLGSLALLVNPTPAFAHADVQLSSPRNGAQVSVAPKKVVITFTEAATLDSVTPRLVDGAGLTLPSTAVMAASVLTITPAKPLGRGITSATWHVISDDSLLISGALAFTVGKATPPGQRTSIVTMPRIATTLSGDRQGPLTLTMASTAKSGEVTWTSDAMPEPIIWTITGNGTTAKASGVLPLAGTWRMSAMLVTSSSEMIMPTGSVVIKATGSL